MLEHKGHIPRSAALSPFTIHGCLEGLGTNLYRVLLFLIPPGASAVPGFPALRMASVSPGRTPNPPVRVLGGGLRIGLWLLAVRTFYDEDQ